MTGKTIDTLKIGIGINADKITLTITAEEAREILSDFQKRKNGIWIYDEILDQHYYCSECKSMGVSYWDYCPYCGADMRGSK